VKLISLKKCGRAAKLEEVQLLALSADPRPITKAKADDAKSLLAYISPTQHR